ncbi:hypothetical protein [Streptomyces kanasensis]|uniref:hypothetical protein n=1 Tax=Streptomyces kanasensis TaxID=936756 RepID=UPI0036FE0091
MPWKFGRVYDVDRQMADHRRPVRHGLPLAEHRAAPPGRQELFRHARTATPARSGGGRGLTRARRDRSGGGRVRRGRRADPREAAQDPGRCA